MSGEALHHGHRQRLRARFPRSGLDGFADYEVVDRLIESAQDTFSLRKAGLL